MFTGLVKDIGTVESITPNREGKVLVVRSSLCRELAIDDSVSINGACQTVISHSDKTFTVQSVGVTLEKTTLSKLSPGHEVNLELAMRLGDRLGGHLVQGHVNSMAKVDNIKNIGNNYLVSLSIEDDIKRYVVKEGSITVDGVSLTVSNIDSSGNVKLSVIPHTWFNTIFKNMRIGDMVNIEVDMIAKYVENLFKYGEKKADVVNKRLITEDWLKEQGY